MNTIRGNADKAAGPGHGGLVASVVAGRSIRRGGERRDRVGSHRSGRAARGVTVAASPPGWTTERNEAFRAFARARCEVLVGPLHEITFAIATDGKVAGSARLRRKDHTAVLEAGLWLARSAQARGIGTAVLLALGDEAAKAGASTLTAETTTTNAAAPTALAAAAA